MFTLLIALASAASTHHAAKPAKSAKPARKWTILEQSAEGSPKVLVAMKPADTVAPVVAGAGPTILGITCDHQGFYVAIRWPNAVKAFTVGKKVPLSLKIDDAPAQTDTWGARESSAFKTGAEGIRWFQSLVAAKRLTVSFADKKSREQAVFDLTGIAAVDTKLQALSCLGPDAAR